MTTLDTYNLTLSLYIYELSASLSAGVISNGEYAIRTKASEKGISLRRTNPST
jgi:hypothetical protein